MADNVSQHQLPYMPTYQQNDYQNQMNTQNVVQDISSITPNMQIRNQNCMNQQQWQQQQMYPVNHQQRMMTQLQYQQQSNSSYLQQQGNVNFNMSQINYNNKQIPQMNKLDQINQMNQMNHANQVNQINHINQMNHVNHMTQINHMNSMNQMGQMSNMGLPPGQTVRSMNIQESRIPQQFQNAWSPLHGNVQAAAGISKRASNVPSNQKVRKPRGRKAARNNKTISPDNINLYPMQGFNMKPEMMNVSTPMQSPRLAQTMNASSPQGVSSLHDPLNPHSIQQQNMYDQQHQQRTWNYSSSFENQHMNSITQQSTVDSQQQYCPNSLDVGQLLSHNKLMPPDKDQGQYYMNHAYNNYSGYQNQNMGGNGNYENPQ